MKGLASRQRGVRFYLRLLIVGLVWGAMLFYTGYLGMWVHAMTRPLRTPPCCITPADLGWPYEGVTLTADDGVTLSGWYVPSQNGAAVILLHGYGANRAQMVERAGLLAAHGYGVLLYDQRASGESEGDIRSWGWIDVRDVPLAIEDLAMRDEVDPRRVGVLGFSQGGQIALRAAAASDRISAVVAEEPGFSTLGDLPGLLTLEDRWIAFNYWMALKAIAWRGGVRDPSGVVESLPAIAPRPILFIATGASDEVGYWLVRHFYDEATGPKAWWHVSEAGHGQVPEARGEAYQERVVSFFDAALLGKGDGAARPGTRPAGSLP